MKHYFVSGVVGHKTISDPCVSDYEQEVFAEHIIYADSAREAEKLFKKAHPRSTRVHARAL